MEELTLSEELMLTLAQAVKIGYLDSDDAKVIYLMLKTDRMKDMWLDYATTDKEADHDSLLLTAVQMKAL